MIVLRHSYISVRGKMRAGGAGWRAARVSAIGTALGHVKYIQYRRGRDLEDGGREMFTDLENSADARTLRRMIREYEGNGVVIHKLTISPEVRPDDPREFTREVMHQLGSEKGLDLDWWAVCHRNTEHHHIHVVVMPKDGEGRTVRFDKADYNRLKEFGDRHLERTQYADWRFAEILREERDRERSKERKLQLERQRQERIRNGEELPWLHRKIIREELQPYQKWRNDQPKEPEQSFDYMGERYSKADGYERLAGLRRHLHESTDKSLRLPKDDYRRLTNWIEEKDRARFSGEIDRQLSAARANQAARDEARNSPAAHRYVSPLQQEIMRNPVMGLFLTEASIAAEIARSITLKDNRDRLKDNRDDLEDAKRDWEAKQRQRPDADQKARDEEIIKKLDEAIEDNKDSRERARKEREERNRRRDRGLDFMR